MPRLRCSKAPRAPAAQPLSWAALGNQQEQHPTGGVPGLKQVVGEANGESSTNSQKATAVYARAILTYFLCK